MEMRFKIPDGVETGNTSDWGPRISEDTEFDRPPIGIVLVRRWARAPGRTKSEEFPGRTAGREEESAGTKTVLPQRVVLF